MKLVSFELTMPNVGSWNGKWTGADRKYYIVKQLKEATLSRGHFAKLRKDHTDSWYCNLGKGWWANVTARIVDAKTARQHRKASVGFYGYEWMIDSIINTGKVIV